MARQQSFLLSPWLWVQVNTTQEDLQGWDAGGHPSGASPGLTASKDSVRSVEGYLTAPHLLKSHKPVLLKGQRGTELTLLFGDLSDRPRYAAQRC